MASPQSAALVSPSPEFIEVFTRHADAGPRMPFDRFMHLALYHPKVGYYRTARTRVGRAPGTDFYTATTTGPLFGELVTAACSTLLGGRDPRLYTFVELGVETEGGALAGVSHPFRDARTVKLGEDSALRGDCIVFSNEVFDAQPFRRFVARNGSWYEQGVELRGADLVEVQLGPVTEAWLPPNPPDGYGFDAPRAANELLARLTTQPWRGLFVAFDYGKSYRELAEFTPAGTGRAYWRHIQSNALLARPGEQDLTCHVCWDWLRQTLADDGFAPIEVDSQEAFFVRHANRFIATTLEGDAVERTPRKRTLMQLLHPANMGQAFQVLHACRW